MKEPGRPVLLSRAEAAAILGISTKAVNGLADREELPFIKTLGGHRRFLAADVNRLAESRVTQGRGVTRDTTR